MSNATMAMTINKGMHSEATPWVDPKQDNRRITPHGFRSTFRDWTGDCTKYENEVCELALAHSKINKTEAAYRRSDMLDRRRSLVQQWADYCYGKV